MATPSRFELPISSLTGTLGKGLCGQAFYAVDIGARIRQRIQMTTTLQPADHSSVGCDEAIARARQFYEEEILPKYGKSHKGHFVVIDGLSLDYEIGRSVGTVKLPIGSTSVVRTRFRCRFRSGVTDFRSGAIIRPKSVRKSRLRWIAGSLRDPRGRRKPRRRLLNQSD